MSFGVRVCSEIGWKLMDELEAQGISYEFYNAATHFAGMDKHMDIEVTERDRELLLKAREKVEKE